LLEAAKLNSYGDHKDIGGSTIKDGKIMLKTKTIPFPNWIGTDDETFIQTFDQGVLQFEWPKKSRTNIPPIIEVKKQ